MNRLSLDYVFFYNPIWVVMFNGYYYPYTTVNLYQELCFYL